MLQVLNIKSKAKEVEDVKPNMAKAFGETVIIYNPIHSLTLGQPMGLLLSLTYAATTTSRSIRR